MVQARGWRRRWRVQGVLMLPASQIGSSPHSGYSVLANGSLLLQPLSKDHHGGWECLATNRVATVGAGTVVTVLGECAAGASAAQLLPSIRRFTCLASPRHQSSRCVIRARRHRDESS